MMEDDDMDTDMDLASDGDGDGDRDRGDAEFEIDLDYEFDAPRFFDLSRPELPDEAREAARWFQTARTYPPSPFVARRETVHMDTTANIQQLTLPDVPTTGSTLHSCLSQDAVNGDMKFHAKEPFAKGSTLMKPTASQMARQKQLLKVKNELRKSLFMNTERSVGDPNDNASREVKRRKLEGGNILKVPGVKQHTSLMHKVSQKIGPAESNPRPPRLTLTIPREPELETTRRATAFRAQRTRFNNTEDLQDGTRPIKYTFKARPLNRKILEAPSFPLPQKTPPRLPSFQEFHLKTHERAIKHSLAAAASSSIPDNRISDSRTRHGATCLEKALNQASGSHEPQNVEGGNVLPKFRARTLNRKIVSSKGDVSGFRSTKHERTKPEEFKLSTNSNCHQSPLTEVFNKLSLASEARQSGAAESKPQQSFQQEPSYQIIRDKYSSFDVSCIVVLLDSGAEQVVFWTGIKLIINQYMDRLSRWCSDVLTSMDWAKS